VKQQIIRAELCNDDGINEINKFLCDGWFVKELHVTSDNENSYAIVLLEKDK
jgi:hypothetical protein